MARKGLPKSIRFEVFKRDKFSCQYCGRQAPDVLLHIDHIEPVVDGGGDEILNLITACEDCNLGKGARSLDDHSVIRKRRKQLEELEERRHQLELMLEWQKSLVGLKDEEIDSLAGFWADLTNRSVVLNQYGRDTLAKLRLKFDVPAILEAMRIARSQYFQAEGDGYTFESIEAGFNKLSGICSVNNAAAKDPDIKRVYYIRGIVRNRLEGRYYDHQRALVELKDAVRQGVDLDMLQDFCSNVTSWTGFREGLYDLVSDEPQTDEC